MTTTSSVVFESLTLGDLRRMGRPLPPAITVLLPSFTPGAQARPNSLRLRNAVDTIFPQLLQQGLAHHECAQLVSPLLALANDVNLREGRSSGVALFLDGQQFFCFDIPGNVPETAVVARHFYVKPLLEWLLNPRDFIILDLGQGRVRLLRSRDSKLSLLRLPKGAPESFEEMSSYGDTHHHGFGGAISFGLGSANEQRRTQFFCSMVDRSLHAYLQDLGVPLVLAGCERLTTAYAEENTYPRMIHEVIRGSIDYLSEQELDMKARFLIHTHQMEEAARYLSAMEEYSPGDRWSTSMDSILRGAVQGRVWRLFVAHGATVRGDFLDGIGHNSTMPPLEEDLLNAAAVETLIHGGEVYPVEPEMLPNQASAVALFRYSLGSGTV